MEYNLILRAGKSGSAKHMGVERKSGRGFTYIKTACGSDITNWGGKEINSKTEIAFKRENITCKKCLKAFDKNQMEVNAG